MNDTKNTTIEDGWLLSAKKIETTHYNQRPSHADISLLVIHSISLPAGEFENENVKNFFCGKLDCSLHPSFESIKDVRVSSHLFINRAGDTLQFVPFTGRAWHAGVSSFEGEADCNDYSIGIELEGTDTLEYSGEQYEQLIQVTRTLMKYYPSITKNRIAGHNEIAPGRKTDPNKSFDWGYFKNAL